MDWIDLARDSDRRRAVASGIHLRVSVSAGNLWTSCETVSFSGRTVVLGVSYVVVSNASGCLILKMLSFADLLQ
jgi:hypothetical protein